jgi:hypothetical protein
LSWNLSPLTNVIISGNPFRYSGLSFNVSGRIIRFTRSHRFE